MINKSFKIIFYFHINQKTITKGNTLDFFCRQFGIDWHLCPGLKVLVNIFPFKRAQNLETGEFSELAFYP